MKRLLMICCATALVAASGAASGDAVSAADSRSVRAVVQSQLDAFAADDADRAFSYAAPSIRQMFGSAQNFIAMVRASYPVVYRPASVAFLVPESVGGEVIQAVHFTDGQGGLWLAVYHLQRQHGNVWRISGCELAESHARTT
jgi:hypothetical protein